MAFSTTSFLYLFLPAFLICYVLLPWRNVVALVFSLLFFAWGEGVYLLLLLITISCNYLLGNQLERPGTRDLLLATGIALNLAVLAYFKYFGFLIADVFSIELAEEDIPHLPLGLSFFIFQSISYLVDVYRHESPRARSWFDLALYIAMFPQLIAGPIVRYSTVAKDLRDREISSFDVYRGSLLFVLGLAYKVLIANNAAEVADAVFALPLEQVATQTAWLGTVAYTVQIFFDFGGYSLMAIGMGRIMGFHFPQNFNYPYISQSITEFWRRWHMSLSSWFRDYLYIPLGGNRCGTVRTYLNLCLVFVLCGLWHGAAWTFLAWGAFHGLVLVVERCGLSKILQQLPRLVRHLYTLTLVMIGWVLFRSEDLTQALRFLKTMFTATDAVAPEFTVLVSNENFYFILLGLALSMPLIERFRVLRHHDSGMQSRVMRPSSIALHVSLAAAVFLVCSVYVMAGTYNPFIYFRF
jgi:alginate O-acetyltransferase complex protein AlgI